MKILQRMTDRSSKSINRYFEEVSKLPMVTMEEEVRLAKLMVDGDKDAEQKLVEANLRFVISVAKQYQNRGLKISDLINEGNLGLIEAVPRFDPTKGFKLISFAVYYIRRNINTALKDFETPFTTPHYRIDMVNKLRVVVKNLENKLERDITVGDIYGTDGFEDWEVDELYELLKTRSSSLNQTVTDDGLILSDVLPSNSYSEMTQDVENDHNSILICMMTKKLPENYKNVVSHLHGIDGYELLSSSDLAEKLSLSRQRIDQIYKSALKKLRFLHDNISSTGKL